MTEEKLPDKLTVKPWPLCWGSSEQEANRLAVEYNSLDSKDSRRGEVHRQYKIASEEVYIGLMD